MTFFLLTDDLQRLLFYNRRMIQTLETQLNDFSSEVRKTALLRLLDLAKKDLGMLPVEGASVNMHCHSFFSFNSYGYSPSALVWLAKKIGLQAAGIVDFDNLDGVEEFLSACDSASLRGSAAMETRIYISELADYVTNSPGEPGVSYATGIGFASSHVNEKGKSILRGMRERADQRNRGMVNRLNAYLDPVAIDYDQDVLPLTPSGNATERHILAAYLSTVQKTIKNPAEFWSKKLEQELYFVSDLMQDPAVFSDVVRRKLMKLGGIGYVQPGPDAFPTAEEFYQMVISNGAIPTYNYLDGSTNGEQRMEEILDLLVNKGISGFNLIPNLAIPELDAQLNNSKKREQQIQLLFHNVEIAREFDLPLHIGTEMNSYGQRKVDNLESPELRPLKKQFIDGAFFIYGHVRLQRTLGLGYQSDWTANWFPTRAERNTFYTKAGYCIPPGESGIRKLKLLHPTMSPSEILSKLQTV